jgi:hypothetical protein
MSTALAAGAALQDQPLPLMQQDLHEQNGRIATQTPELLTRF